MLLFIIGGHVNFLYPVIIAITKKLIIPERDSERITPIVINRMESSVIIFPCFIDAKAQTKMFAFMICQRHIFQISMQMNL